jgi:F-type H+-transporting ATPase subunit alpha
VIYAANKGYVDQYELPVLQRYKKELLEYMHTSQAQVVDSIKSKRAIDGDNEPGLQAALKSFGEVFDPKKV